MQNSCFVSLSVYFTIREVVTCYFPLVVVRLLMSFLQENDLKNEIQGICVFRLVQFTFSAVVVLLNEATTQAFRFTSFRLTVVKSTHLH